MEYAKLQLKKPPSIDSEKKALSLVPYGMLVTRKWLLAKNVSRPNIDSWVRQGLLQSLVPGVMARAETKKLTWQAVVVSLQRMWKHYGLTPGGITALEEQGYAHYIPRPLKLASAIRGNRPIHMYGVDPLPAWLDRLTVQHLPEIRFVWHGTKEFGEGFLQNNTYDTESVDHLMNQMAWGTDEWPLTISSPERAVFELLADIPDQLGFQHADELLRGLPSLSPRKLNKLLELCESYKVRRLFLWFAERHQHPWFKHLDLTAYTMEGGKLGHGKRVIAKEGRLDRKYLITVPEDMYGQK